jgi:CDP-diacylglycerol--glycerol-3-phosphate 3-phosphatidyltransferase
MNIANKLTLARIVLIPIFIAFFYINVKYQYLYAAIIFVIAAITDLLDGRLARKHDMVTNFGKLIDPIADKLLVCSALVMLLTVQSFNMSALVVIILIGREFIVSGLRLIAAAEGKVVAASGLGKIKTVVQIVAVCTVLVEGYIFIWDSWNFPLGLVLMWISAAIAVVSLVDYFIKNRQVLKTLF